MLMLSRTPRESIIIGDNIEITVIEINNGQVKLGITAPRNIPVNRKEVYLQVKNENKKAAKITNSQDLKKLF